MQHVTGAVLLVVGLGVHVTGVPLHVAHGFCGDSALEAEVEAAGHVGDIVVTGTDVAEAVVGVGGLTQTLGGGGVQAVVGEELGVVRVGRVYGEGAGGGGEAAEAFDPGADDLRYEVDIVVDVVATVHIEGVTAAGGRGGRDLTVVEVAAALEADEWLLAAAVGIGGTGQGAVFPDGIPVGVEAGDPLHVAAVGAGGIVALLGEIITIPGIDDVLLVVLVDRHQRALLAVDARHDGAAGFIAARLCRGTEASLEGQALIALFEHHVDDTADGVGTIDGRTAIQVDFDPLNGGHGDGVEVDGGAAHGGGTRHPLAVQQHQGAL
ncbi:hypothetical protein D3C75_639620 [compost metagenome]